MKRGRILQKYKNINIKKALFNESFLFQFGRSEAEGGLFLINWVPLSSCRDSFNPKVGQGRVTGTNVVK